MACFAPVVPLAVAKVLKEEGTLGNYHLLLAHDVVEHPDEYREVYGEYCHKGRGMVILDNSLIELGKSFTYDGIIEAAEILNPSFVVLPDTLGDVKATCEASKEFHAYLHERRLDGKWPLMGVMQGKTVQECMQCAFELAPMIHGLCIPRHLVKELGSRTEMAQWAIARFREMTFHLLGFSDDILDDICTARLYGVEGIDSAVPLRLAVEGIGIAISDEVLAKAGPRGNFWNTSTEQTERWKFLMNHNMEYFRRWIAPKRTRL
jgi:hypothetical protein